MTELEREGSVLPRIRRARRRLPPLTLICGAFLALIVVCMVFGGWIAPHDAYQQNPMLSVSSPNAEHPLGTDQLGRDVLSRLIVGARYSIAGPLVVAIGCVVGVVLGLAAAVHGRITDSVISRATDLIVALPGLLIAIVIIGVMGGGYWVGAGVLLILFIPWQIRMSRNAAIVQINLPYIDAAKTLGISTSRVMLRHVLPNIVPTAFTAFLLDLVNAINAYAALSYLGIGEMAEVPSWGGMLAEGQKLITMNPWLSVAPALLLIATSASITVVGDWCHERLNRKKESRA